MTKQEYLEKLSGELRRGGVPDAEEIVFEYEQHFSFKQADGYTEEQIAEKLGAPESIAMQFLAQQNEQKPTGGKKAFLRVWLALLGLLEALLDLVFAGIVVVFFAAGIAFAGVGAALIGHFQIAGLLPAMPYAGGLLLGVSLVALGVLFGLAGFYLAASLRQIVRASARWHKNALGGGLLPPLPWNAQFPPKTKRRLRRVLTVSIMVFGAAFVAGYAVLGLATHALGFWHALGWFGYVAP